ncbi:MAG: DDE-type integrase/transposase/recombinase [Cyanobacteria bacterium P01_A01_bin.80]
MKKSELLSNKCELRQKKYINNIVEQDHRFPKKLAKYKSYFQYFYTAWRTLKGYKIMNVISISSYSQCAMAMNEQVSVK